MARRDNVTGIPMLSIGTTKNYRGYILHRYCVNFIDDNNTPVCRSFYFGKNKTQQQAFLDACDFLRELGEDLPGSPTLKRIYRDKKHESLI